MISLKSAARGERGLAFTDHSGGCPAAVGGDHSLSSMMCIKFCFVFVCLFSFETYRTEGQNSQRVFFFFFRGLEAGIEWVCSSVISWGLKHLLLAFHFQKKTSAKTLLSELEFRPQGLSDWPNSHTQVYGQCELGKRTLILLWKVQYVHFSSSSIYESHGEHCSQGTYGAAGSSKAVKVLFLYEDVKHDKCHFPSVGWK